MNTDNKEDLMKDLRIHIKNRILSFCDHWVIKDIIKKLNQVRFSENNIDISKNWDEVKFELFLSKKRRTLEISISDLRKHSVNETLDHCEKILNSAKRNSNFKDLPEGPFNYDNTIQKYIFDPKVLELQDDATAIVDKSIEQCLQEGAKRVAGSFFFGATKFRLETSEDIVKEFQRTNLNFRIRAFAKDMYATGEGLTVSTHLEKGFQPIQAGREAGEICKNAINGKKGKPGIYNIIIYPKVATEIQAPTPAIAMNSYIKKMGLSWLAGVKEGDQIGNENITVWDNGKKKYGLASSPVDDEGSPSKNTLLIEKGRLKQFFTNHSLSERNRESTGNAGITIPKPTNTVFKSGNHSLEEMMEISEIPTLLITSTWYTRYQSYAPPGKFSSLPKDGMFLVENRGKTLIPIRELRINSDHYEMLENTIALGKKIKQVTTWLNPSNNSLFAPFMLIKNIKMTTGTK